MIVRHDNGEIKFPSSNKWLKNDNEISQPKKLKKDNTIHHIIPQSNVNSISLRVSGISKKKIFKKRKNSPSFLEKQWTFLRYWTAWFLHDTFTFDIVWTNHSSNLINLSLNRHNLGLNQRYWWDNLPILHFDIELRLVETEYLDYMKHVSKSLRDFVSEIRSLNSVSSYNSDAYKLQNWIRKK